MTAAGFRIRKVKLEQSIGDKLKRARIRRKISVAEVEEGTRIRAKFILALESDSWDQIPSEVYGRGYLEAYAEYLKLPVEALMKQYDRARAMYKRHEADAVELAPVVRQTEPRFLLTPRFFMISSISIAALAFAGMVGYQFHRFTSAPFLQLITPAEAKTIGTSQLEVYADNFTVHGKTTEDATVFVNGTRVPLTTGGEFSTVVQLEPGTNQVDVKAVSPNGTNTEEPLMITVKQ